MKLLYRLRRAWYKTGVPCTLFGCLMMHWSQPGDGIYQRSKFFKGTAILKNPQCVRCECKEHTCKEQEYAYRKKLKKQGLV